MMASLHGLKRFVRTLTGHLVVGGMLIHALLIPLLFVGLVVIVKESTQDRFVDQVRSDARLFSRLIAKELSQERIRELLDDALLDGRIVYAGLDVDGETIIAKGSRLAMQGNFREDAFFGQHDDSVYSILVPVQAGQHDGNAVLKLGYDETPVVEQINRTFEHGLYLALGYVLMSMIFGTYMGAKVTRPLRNLRDAASEIASGATRKQLAVDTKISEVTDLAAMLEAMRKELVRNSDDLATRETYLQAIMDNVMDGIVTVDGAGRIFSANPAVERIFGYRRAELIGRGINVLLEPETFAEDRNAHDRQNSSLFERLALHKGQVVETRGRRNDSEIFPVELTISDLPLDDHGQYIVVFRDITQRKRAEEELKELQASLERRVVVRTRELAAANQRLEYQALHDALTDLPNGVLLKDRLHQAIQVARQERRSLALLMLDLDHFKEVNDTLGHHTGDLLLQLVARRKKSLLQETDTLARLGGDEFAVLLPRVNDVREATKVARRIVTALEEPFMLEGHSFRIGTSIGVALYPDHGTDAATLMRHADVALYVAKGSSSGCSVYDAKKDENTVNRLSLMNDLRRAIDNEELILSYQPKIEAATGRVSEIEALVRWKHPKRGLIMPDEFIFLAEHSGLIRPLTAWVLEAAVRQCREFQQEGLTAPTIAVNLSMHNLHDAQLPEYIARVLNTWHVSPGCLMLEITESAIMADSVGALDVLTRLHYMGMRLAIDDFGTGYSSLAYLKQLPVDEIKIDKSFTVDLEKNAEDLVIVRSTIDLAHNMGLRVTAEGVESRKAWDILVKLGCDMLQGYYITPPMPPEKLQEWLNRNTPGNRRLLQIPSRSGS